MRSGASRRDATRAQKAGGSAARPGAALPLAALEGVPVPVMVVDARGRVLQANAAMRLRARAGAPEPTLAAQYPEYHAALASGLEVAREVPVVRHAHGAVVHERLAAQPTPWGTAITAIDETLLTELAIRNMQTTRLASLGFMVAGVCHEVSNPLAAIHSMVQILQSKRGASPEMLEKGLAAISSNIARVLAITRTLTEFSRVREGPIRTVTLAQAVENAASLLRHRAGANAIAVDAAIDPDVEALAQPSQLEQVVFNILLNAAQAMDGEGRVTVTGHRRGPRAVLTIRDEGAGIAPEHLGRVFEPFFTTKPDGVGTGLGLTISSEIVRELGGDLRAGNHPQGGACFVIELPAAEPRP
ncbi:MAG TPA: ATP-binding protein [Burkholderiales bacterium]|nr:ATP-binding protein [Burkholderiales bacterium]